MAKLKSTLLTNMIFTISIISGLTLVAARPLGYDQEQKLLTNDDTKISEVIKIDEDNQ